MYLQAKLFIIKERHEYESLIPKCPDHHMNVNLFIINYNKLEYGQMLYQVETKVVGVNANLAFFPNFIVFSYFIKV